MYANSLTCIKTENGYENGCGVYGVSGRLELFWIMLGTTTMSLAKSIIPRISSRQKR
jgi:hypothetical protein